MDIDFKQCMFYPSGGTDLQVLLRYSDIFQTVISPNLSAYLRPEQYEIVFRDRCDYLNKQYGEELLVYEGRTDIDTSFIEKNLM